MLTSTNIVGQHTTNNNDYSVFGRMSAGGVVGGGHQALAHGLLDLTTGAPPATTMTSSWLTDNVVGSATGSGATLVERALGELRINGGTNNNGWSGDSSATSDHDDVIHEFFIQMDGTRLALVVVTLVHHCT